MNILVTGGAGYIGSHAVRHLLDHGYEVTVLDNLSHGHHEAVDPRAHLIGGSTSDRALLKTIFREKGIRAVMHFAADIEVAESMVDPAKYYENNFANSLHLLAAMRDSKVKKIVFSSTAAVYGSPEIVPILETQARMPINPYGRSKMMTEMAIEDSCYAYGLGYAILRYFNVAGAHPSGEIGEDHHPETHLIPRLLQAAAAGKGQAQIYGEDYDTPDGTCVRDYVHVMDLVESHRLALEHIFPGNGNIYNIGSESGFTVREVVSACERITGKPIEVTVGPRRAGDPPKLVASSQKIRAELGWNPKYSSLDNIIEHAWHWHRSRPHGYSEPAEKIGQASRAMHRAANQ